MSEDPNERGVESRVKKFQSLKEKIENYETLLSGTATDLKTRIDDLGRKLHAKLA
jgi:ppGpp synthetase/RelA/SpoT-type nucleotidyltranferase